MNLIFKCSEMLDKCGDLIKIDTPILIGFQWDYSLQFATGTQANPIYLDLDLYDIFFAIRLSPTSTVSLVPSITKLENGLAAYRFSPLQTSGMMEGKWTGHSFLKLKASGTTDFLIDLEVCAIKPVPNP